MESENYTDDEEQHPRLFGKEAEEREEQKKLEKKISKEKQKEYNSKFYAGNKNKKYMCEICRKEVNYFNKSKHIKTALHQRLSK